MNIFVTILIVSAFLVCLRISHNFDYEEKTNYSLLGLAALIVLTCIQAKSEQVFRISIAWFLVALIFVVLFISTYLSKRELNKAVIDEAEEISEEYDEEPYEEEAIGVEFEEVETPPAPPTV